MFGEVHVERDYAIERAAGFEEEMAAELTSIIAYL